MKELIVKIQERFEAMAMAVAYAEAGEWSSAERIMDRNQPSQTRHLEKRDARKKQRPPRMRV